MKDLILAIDQGTTGSRCIFFDPELKVQVQAYREISQIYPRPGWVEHSPESIWESVRSTAQEAMRNGRIDPKRIAGIGITNQRETSIVWERKTGTPIANAIVWQDRRTADICEKLRKEGKEEAVREATGLLLDPYFSGTKLFWMLENLPGARRRAETGELAFGTIDSFLLYRLSGGKVHLTEVSNASRTLLLNLKTQKWDPRMLEIFQIPEPILSQLGSSAGIVGETRGLDFLPDGIPVSGMIGDQQSALFGQRCFEPSAAKLTLGTGSFLLVNLGSNLIHSRHRLLTTIAWRIGDKPVQYALEGSAFIAGAAVQWLRDGLNIIHKSGEVEALAGSVPDSGGVMFVPALVGLGAPYWRAEARGIILGIDRGTTRAHLARATLEGIALINVDLIQAIKDDTGADLRFLRVDGGAAANNLLMKMLADFSGVEVVRPAQFEATALGAAMLAGLGSGLFKGLEDFKRVREKPESFKPDLDPRAREEIRKRWREAVGKA